MMTALLVTIFVLGNSATLILLKAASRADEAAAAWVVSTDD